MLHMKLQSQLIGKIAHAFGLPKYVVSTDDVQKYQRMIGTWMQGFPKWYSVDVPDESQDKKHPWIQLHRHYLHTMAHSMILDPIRPFLAKHMSQQTPAAELEVRRDGISYCLSLVKALYKFFKYVYPRDSKFHFVIFCLFDTASVMCSVIIHDQDDSAPQKHDMLVAVDGALAMLKKLSHVTDGAKTSHQVLHRIAQRAKAAAGTSEQAAVSTSEPMNVTKAGQMVGQIPARDDINEASEPAGEPAANLSRANAYSGNAVSQPPVSDAASLPYSEIPQAPLTLPHPCSNGYHPPEYPHTIDHSVPSHYPMQNVMPPMTYAPQPALHYAMNSVPVTTTAESQITVPAHFNYNHPGFGPDQFTAQMPPPDFPVITEEELGQLAAMWHYRSLNFDFINPKP